MEFSKVVEGRRSVRNYDGSREITDAQLRELFEIVKLSPSSYNLQPWEFIVVRKGRERLFACTYSQMHVLDASATIIVLANKNPLAHAADILDDRLSKGYYVDPSARLLTMGRIKAIASSAEASLVWAVKSASLAAMTLMFAAYDMGLAACPIESFDKNAVKKEFKIPDDYEAIMLITLGYQSADQKPRLKRYGFDEIVHFEEF